MSTNVKFYTMAFETPDGTVTDISLKEFLNSIEEKFLNRELKIKRNIDEKDVKIFRYYRDDFSPKDRFVIPFGIKKLINPYSENDNDELEEVDLDLYDINSLYFNANESVIMLTYDRPGPSFKVVQNYLNDLVESQYVIRIKPIIHNIGIDVLRTSPQVKSLIIALDLAHNITDIYNEQTRNQIGALNLLSNFAESVHENISNNTFTISLGLGRERNATLDIRCVIDMLEKFNLDSACIKEITVTYKDGVSENIESAKLKNNDLELKFTFHLNERSLSPEYLQINADTALTARRRDFAPKTREYYERVINANTDYTLNLIDRGENIEQQETVPQMV